MLPHRAESHKDSSIIRHLGRTEKSISSLFCMCVLIYLLYSLPSTWAWSHELQFHFRVKRSGFATSRNTHNINYKLQRNKLTLMNIQKKSGVCHAPRWFPEQWRVKQCVSFLLSRPLGWLIIADCELFRDLDFHYPACTGSIAVGPLLTCSVSVITYTTVDSKNTILKRFPSFGRQPLHQHVFLRMAWQAAILFCCKRTNR